MHMQGQLPTGHGLRATPLHRQQISRPKASAAWFQSRHTDATHTHTWLPGLRKSCHLFTSTKFVAKMVVASRKPAREGKG